MSKWAKLHAKISESYDFAEACNEDPRAGLLFVLGIAHADVYGVLVGDPRLLAGRVFGLVRVTEEEVVAAVAILVKVGLVLQYSDDRGHVYLWFPKYTEYQSVEWVRVGPPEHPLPEAWGPPEALFEAVKKTNSKGQLLASESLRRWVAGLSEDHSAITRRPLGDHSTLDTDTELDTEPDTDKVDSALLADAEACPECGKVHKAKPTDKMGAEERTLNRAFEAMTGRRLSCVRVALVEKQRSTGKEDNPLRGINGLIDLVGATNDALIEELIGSPNRPQLPDGKQPWSWFSKHFRDSINRPWEWRKQSGGTGPERFGSFAGWPARLVSEDLLFKPTAAELRAMIESPDWSKFPSLDRYMAAPVVDRIREARQEWESKRGSV